MRIELSGVFMEVTKLTSTANKIEAEMIVQKLKDNGISCYYKDNAAGGYMDITSGFSVFGQEIFINKNDMKRARALIEQVNEVESYESNEINVQSNRRRMLIKVYLGLVIIMFLVTIVIIILSKFSN